MIKSTFDIGAVSQAVSFWIPGFRCGSGGRQPEAGDTVSYGLRVTRNELIEDFAVEVEVLDGGSARVTVTGQDGRSFEVGMSVSDGSVLAPITGQMVPLAIEGLPTGSGTTEYTVCMFSGKRSAMAWVHDGIAYRTIHDHEGFRLCFDLSGSSLL